MKRIQVGLDEETLALVDEQRGLVARERWLRQVIRERVAVGRGGVLVPEPREEIRWSPPRAEPPPRTDDVTQCAHPKAEQRIINGGATVCGACNRRIK